MSKKKQVKSIIPTVHDYTDYDDRTHVYMKPGMYIGSDSKLLRDEWLFDIETRQMKYREIDFVPGCERIFLEILSNASDHCGKTKRGGENAGNIVVTMNNKTISVKNGGLPIPIEKVPNTDVWLPQKIFGQLRTSSHYEEEERHEVGTNGIGSKAANVFSTHFSIVIENHIVGKKYSQTWEENMKVCKPPTITDYKGKNSSVFVQYTMDFKRFGLEEYPQEAFELYARHAADTSFNAKVMVIFNNKELNYHDIKEYGRLYFGDFVKNSIVVKADTYELLIVDTPDAGNHVSFVNCMMTREGGVHVNAAYKAIGEPLVYTINERMEKKLDKLGMDEREKKTHLVSIKDVKPHLSILFSCKLVNPDFQGNTKSILTKPVPKIDIDVKILAPILDWKLVERLNGALEAKHAFHLAKTDGKQGWHVNVDIDKFRDADYAGTARSSECILCIGEGRSAVGYLSHYIGAKENGMRYYGVLPLRGKCLNVLCANEKQLERNREINAIKAVLGLKENINYGDPAQLKKLRYGQILITTDSDEDGKHIIGLLINLFNARFPSLLKIENFIVYKRTPIVRMTKGKKKLKFYSQREFEIWYNNNKDAAKGWFSVHMKGLGSSLKEDILDDIKDEKIVTCIYDKDANETLQLAFNSKLSNKRKEWISNYVERDDVDTMIKQPISLFINHEMILFSKANNKRAIPKLMDGFKESQRKIMFGTHKNFDIGSLNKHYKQLIVADLDSYIRKEAGYRHGTLILSKAIILMGQDFVGSNNINLFEPRGNFGTRFHNGTDAAEPRYPSTVPSQIVPYIYLEDDQPLLVPVVDEGQSLEPETYLPIVPTVLINGALGIGTAYSTYIPCHNPFDIVDWLRARLTGKSDLPNIKPWYRGFKGEITIIDRRKTKWNESDTNPSENPSDIPMDELEEEKIYAHDKSDLEEDEDAIDSEEEVVEQKPLLSFIVTGCYTVAKNGDIIITELPIGVSPYNYLNKCVKKWLETKYIKKYHDLCDTDKVHFELKGFKETPSFKTLNLRRRYSLSNMVLLNKKFEPIRYDTATDIMESFYTERFPYFEQRKTYKLTKLQNDINKLNERIKFTTAIIKKDLVIQNVSKQMIYEKLKQLDIPQAIYDHAKLSDISREDVLSLNAKVEVLQKEHQKLSKTSVQELWLHDLKMFESKLKEMYH